MIVADFFVFVCYLVFVSFRKVRFLLVIVFLNCSACFFDSLDVPYAPYAAMASANAKNASVKV